MSNTNVKKIIFSILMLISIFVIFSYISEIWYIKSSKLYTPETPQDGVLYVTANYLIDPYTILESLNDGNSDVFTYATEDMQPSISSSLPSNSLLWNAEDYLYIANALHEHEWNESLEKWQLYSMKFSINRCNNVEEGIDFADLTYYQRQGDLYIVHGMWISPLLREVTTVDNQYLYRNEWMPIDTNNLAVKTPETALKLAETSGGRNARKKLGENGCDISLYLRPDAPVINLFENPFKLSGLGWEVKYWDNDSDTIFWDTINAYSGK